MANTPDQFAGLRAWTEQMTVVTALEKLAARERKKLDEISHELPPGLSVPVIFGGKKAAHVSIPKASEHGRVDDMDALLAWVKRKFPHWIITTEQINPEFVKTILTTVATYGCWPNQDTGEQELVPGVSVRVNEHPTPRVILEEQVVLEALQSGELNLRDMLALEAGGDVS